MTREEAKEWLPIIQAWAEDKSIQCQADSGSWIDINKDVYTSNPPSKYRIKPEPKYRPFKSQKECWQEMLKHQPFGWIRGNIKYYLISTLNDVGIWFSDKVSYTFRESIDNFTFADGTPFGIMED